MAPFIALIVSFIVFRTAGLAGIEHFDSWHNALRAAVCCMLLLTASAHWGKRRGDLVRMVPASLPRPDQIVTITGWLEIIGAIGIVIPATSRIASILLVILLLVMFPANVRAAKHGITLDGKPPTPLLLRSILQVVFVCAILLAG